MQSLEKSIVERQLFSEHVKNQLHGMISQ